MLMSEARQLMRPELTEGWPKLRNRFGVGALAGKYCELIRAQDSERLHQEERKQLMYQALDAIDPDGVWADAWHGDAVVSTTHARVFSGKMVVDVLSYQATSIVDANCARLVLPVYSAAEEGPSWAGVVTLARMDGDEVSSGPSGEGIFTYGSLSTPTYATKHVEGEWGNLASTPHSVDMVKDRDVDPPPANGKWPIGRGDGYATPSCVTVYRTAAGEHYWEGRFTVLSGVSRWVFAGSGMYYDEGGHVGYYTDSAALVTAMRTDLAPVLVGSNGPHDEQTGCAELGRNTKYVPGHGQLGALAGVDLYVGVTSLPAGQGLIVRGDGTTLACNGIEEDHMEDVDVTVMQELSDKWQRVWTEYIAARDLMPLAEAREAVDGVIARMTVVTDSMDRIRLLGLEDADERMNLDMHLARMMLSATSFLPSHVNGVDVLERSMREGSRILRCRPPSFTSVGLLVWYPNELTTSLLHGALLAEYVKSTSDDPWRGGPAQYLGCITPSLEVRAESRIMLVTQGGKKLALDDAVTSLCSLCITKRVDRGMVMTSSFCIMVKIAAEKPWVIVVPGPRVSSMYKRVDAARPLRAGYSKASLYRVGSTYEAPVADSSI
jgi:hypothetical protein